MARWACWLVLVAGIALGLAWGALHFLIVPRIDAFGPWLEQQASQRLGVPVRLGSMVARSNGLLASLELREVQILDTSGHAALRLPLVLVALSPRSVLGWGFEQLYIDGPELEVRRSADGRIWIAGMELPTTQSNDHAAVDWLFAQPEVVLRHGILRWRDELRNQPTLQLGEVQLILRKQYLGHHFRVDAKAPAGWGTQMTLMGQFQQPLWTLRAGDWRNWVGQVFAQADHLDLAQLRNYVDLGAERDLTQGSGSVRAWLDVDHSRITSATADLALQAVSARLAADLEPLELQRISGRLVARQSGQGKELLAQGLSFTTRDGLHWPGGNLQLTLTDAAAPAQPQHQPPPQTQPQTPPQKPAHGSLRADRLNLAAVSQVASRLPLNAKLRSTLRQLAPQGRVDRLQVDWQGAWPQATGFTAKGRVSQLALASQPADTAGALGVPGLQGASVDFDIHENGGKAQLLMLDGVMDFPGVFDQPRVPFGLLQGEVQWQYDAQRIQVQANHLRFANRDAQGELQFKWQNAPVPPGTSPASGTPGLLDLQGSLGRARVVAVPRYLPSAMNTEVRNYLAQALVAGEGSNVYFKVKGDLNQFPFAPEKGGAGGITNGAGGEFQISADIRNASYAYLPPALQPGDSPPWPMLTHLSTHMLLDRDRLEFKASKGLLGAEGHLPFDRTVVRISDLYNATTVTVYTNLHGPLAEALAVVNSTPVGGMMGHALARSRVQGQADYHIGLGIALAHPDQIVVQGTVLLGNADFQFSPEVPPISHLKGPVSFTQNGFSLAGVQGRALGGDVQLDGGMVFGSSANAANATDGLHIQGTVTAEGLRAAPQLGLVRSLARFASGSAAYSVNLSLRNGVPEWAVNSPLRGMELNLPEPFAKSADSNWPLRVATALVPGTQQEGVRLQDQWEVDVGQLLHLRYVRDIAGAAPKVLRGAIALGLQDDESAPLPDAGVFANLRFNDVDADSWQAVVKRLTEAEPDQSSSPERAPPVSSTASSTDSTASTDSSTDYLPGRVALQAHQLTLGGRSFNQVLLGGTHEGGVWHGNVYADELDGYVEYLQSSDSTPGRVYARLGHLRLGPSAQQDVENLFDQQPASVPALDIVVEEMHLHGKNLGRVEVQATHIGVLLHPDTAWHPASDTTQNTAPDTASDTASDTPPVTASVAAAEPLREWRLDRLNIMTPEAVFSATGNWASIHPQLPQPPELPVSQPGLLERRRTRLNFRLDVVDSGALLSRFGMPGVIAKGRGKVQGQVSWLGSPFSPDYPSMGGGFNLDIESGQFLKAEPGIAKLLGVLSLQSLPRRLTLDFRDVFSEGFSFDFVRGDASIEQGIARTSNLQMKGINANVLMEGQADLNKETQSLSVVVVPEVNVSSATLLYSTVNPAVGLSVYLANLALRDPLATANTRAFQIDGTWVSPQVTQVERKP